MILSAVLLLAVAVQQPTASVGLRGVVVDAAGLPVPGALVSANGVSVATDPHGGFILETANRSNVLEVTAEGFATFSASVTPGDVLRIVLQPARVSEALTVTATRSPTRLSDTATATTSVPAAVILTSAALSADDLLRSVPGFSLFRRSSSRVANPTTQGASLRGLSASGASRALVLADGVPLNDAFGGWVYWNRVPQAAIDRIEVVRGGAGADLYGFESLAGTVQLLATQPSRASARVSGEAGTHGAARLSAYGGLSASAWRGFAAAERFVFDGFPVVAADERGPADVNAGTRHSSVLTSASHAGPSSLAELRADWLDEDRENGTPLQTNRTTLWGVSGRVSGTGASGAWSAAAHGGATRFRQTFSAVNAARTMEVLTARQDVRSNHQGISAQWTGGWRATALLAGTEFRRTSGRSVDVSRGGTQTDTAMYVRATAQFAPALVASLGVRGGLWRASADGPAGVSRDRFYAMPRASIAWSLRPGLALSAAWSAPARRPTLNELYRDFRVGGTVTQANPFLTPEQARSFEGGVLMTMPPVSARIVGFWTTVDDAITNVTLESGAIILRQRLNAGVIRARGFEAEMEWRPVGWASAAAGAAMLDSVFASSPERGLTGRRVPQVPEWHASASLRLMPGRVSATIDWRAMGPQYDDDRNQFLLARGYVTDVFVGVSLRRAQPFIAVENVFDAEVDVGRTPVRTTGTPRIVRGGVRVHF